MDALRPPAVSEIAPDFSLPDASGSALHLSAACAERPQVLVFYRGHW